MFLDASAIVAVLRKEPAFGKLVAAIENSKTKYFSSPISQYEAVLSLARSNGKTPDTHDPMLRNATKAIEIFMMQVGAQQMPVENSSMKLAIDSFARYGRGSGHAAKLNMGDCFAYAMAKSLNVPLLFIGNDFIHTDIESALPDPCP